MRDSILKTSDVYKCLQEDHRCAAFGPQEKQRFENAPLSPESIRTVCNGAGPM